MNIYELFGLLLVLGMVVMLLVAAHALGEGERIDAAPRGRDAEEAGEAREA